MVAFGCKDGVVAEVERDLDLKCSVEEELGRAGPVHLVALVRL